MIFDGICSGETIIMSVMVSFFVSTQGWAKVSNCIAIKCTYMVGLHAKSANNCKNMAAAASKHSARLY